MLSNSRWRQEGCDLVTGLVSLLQYYADDTTLIAESEELKSFLLKVKKEGENIHLKLNMQKTMIMASGPITS